MVTGLQRSSYWCFYGSRKAGRQQESAALVRAQTADGQSQTDGTFTQMEADRYATTREPIYTGHRHTGPRIRKKGGKRRIENADNVTEKVHVNAAEG